MQSQKITFHVDQDECSTNLIEADSHEQAALLNALEYFALGEYDVVQVRERGCSEILSFVVGRTGETTADVANSNAGEW